MATIPHRPLQGIPTPTSINRPFAIRGQAPVRNPLSPGIQQLGDLLAEALDPATKRKAELEKLTLDKARRRSAAEQAVIDAEPFIPTPETEEGDVPIGQFNNPDRAIAIENLRAIGDLLTSTSVGKQAQARVEPKKQVITAEKEADIEIDKPKIISREKLPGLRGQQERLTEKDKQKGRVEIETLKQGGKKTRLTQILGAAQQRVETTGKFKIKGIEIQQVGADKRNLLNNQTKVQVRKLANEALILKGEAKLAADRKEFQQELAEKIRANQERESIRREANELKRETGEIKIDIAKDRRIDRNIDNRDNISENIAKLSQTAMSDDVIAQLIVLMDDANAIAKDLKSDGIDVSTYDIDAVITGLIEGGIFTDIYEALGGETLGTRGRKQLEKRGKPTTASTVPKTGAQIADDVILGGGNDLFFRFHPSLCLFSNTGNRRG